MENYLFRQESSLFTGKPGHSQGSWQEATSYCVQASTADLCWLPGIVKILAPCHSILQKVISQNWMFLQGCVSILNQRVVKWAQHHSGLSSFHFKCCRSTFSKVFGFHCFEKKKQLCTHYAITGNRTKILSVCLLTKLSSLFILPQTLYLYSLIYYNDENDNCIYWPFIGCFQSRHLIFIRIYEKGHYYLHLIEKKA